MTIVWSFVATLAAATIVAVAGIIAWSGQQTNDKITEMVKSGADPIAATCALSGVGTSQAQTNICLTAAMRGTGQALPKPQ